MTWNNIELEAIEPVENEAAPRVEIPWEEIDKWIASLSFDQDQEEKRPRRKFELDAGDRRN